MSSSGGSFGYFPDTRKLDDVLRRGQFTRALAIESPLKAAYAHGRECKIQWKPEVQLPVGIYFFEGIDEGSLVMQVGGGNPPGGAEVVDLDALAENHPLASAWSLAEELWSAAEIVPPALFNINDDAVTHPGDADAIILDRQFHSNAWSYSVSVEGRRQAFSESGLRPRPQVDDPQTWVTGEPTPANRFGATLTRAKLHSKLTDTLFSFRATRTTFRPYQFKPVLKLLQTGKARLLIADEVGLGKTIEAGLIWTELEARGEADHVLVVCPSSLVAKWQEEMSDRFDFDLVELDSGGLNTFLQRHQQNRLPARASYICSLERLRAWTGLDDMREFPPEFDLVIVDEAHSMRNKGNKSYALGTELSDWADSLVFLTATPINLRHADLSNLLELLAPEDYGDISDLQLRLEPNQIINAVTAKLTAGSWDGNQLIADLDKLRGTTLGGSIMQRPDFQLLIELLSKGVLEPREVVAAKRLLVELNTLSTVITRTRKVEVDDQKAKRTEARHQIRWQDAEARFYDEYVRWCGDRAAEMNAPVHFAMQMPLRLASACLPMARRAVLDPVGYGKITDADNADTDSIDRLEPHPELISAALALPEGCDTKFDSLRSVLHELHSQGRRALVFTFSVPTLAYLADRLRGDFRVVVMNGSVKREQRRKIIADFRSGAFDFVFANRVASEGLDFEFCSAVINYDLPWNPMEIEQRIGRIDRIGQKEDSILVVNFFNAYTIDERILERLLDRIAIFESSIGTLEPIIAANAPKALQAGFDFSLSDEQREQKVREVLVAIEEQRAGVQELSDASGALLITNDVDVAGLEQDLVRTGRYFGQRELALLIDDWAQIEGAQGMQFGSDGTTVMLRGNAAMAARVDELAAKAQRTRNETGPISTLLRSEVAMPLVLDQELARTGGGTLLTSTSPLIVAAVAVPDHRHSRFASLRLSAAANDVSPGVYVVVLARAASGSGDEIWGSAVTIAGRIAGEDPANALLAALAKGRLTDASPPEVDDMPRLAEQALDQLYLRLSSEQVRRDKEFRALQEARRVTLGEQHRRRVETIAKRIQTAASRGRGSRTMALFHSQMRRAEERFTRLSAELENRAEPEIRLEPIAACVIDITESISES